MELKSPVAELVARRRSCRSYDGRPLADGDRRALEACLAAAGPGPFGGRARFALVAASAADHRALEGLGTYGFIDGAAGFILGAIARAPRDLEDYGWLMERAILRATDLGLGTCWLGGSFRKSAFARRLALAGGELMPAVAAVGYARDGGISRDRIRRLAGSNFRRPADQIFFDGDFRAPLAPGAAGAFAAALEAVRWAPSASNRQPWRVVRTPSGWHLHLARTRGYGKGTLVFSLLGIADLQRVDMGIAMCHLELAARESGLDGAWVLEDPGVAAPGAGLEYVATWRPLRTAGKARRA